VIYLDGRGRESKLEGWSDNWGTIVTPSSYREPPETREWAADCEAYTGRFKWERFSPWLDSMEPYRELCLFVTVPDVVADATATLEMWDRYADLMGDGWWPLAYVAQDGCESLEMPEAAALFVGGTTEWKLSAASRDVIGEAIARGMWVHIGRVNTVRRIRYAWTVGADSVDGTCLCFGADANGPKLRAAMAQPSLSTEVFRCSSLST